MKITDICNTPETTSLSPIIKNVPITATIKFSGGSVTLPLKDVPELIWRRADGNIVFDGVFLFSEECQLIYGGVVKRKKTQYQKNPNMILQISIVSCY